MKLADALCEIKRAFYAFHQGRHMSLQRYYELFQTHVEVLEQVGGNNANEGLAVTIAESNGQGTNPNADDWANVREQTLAVLFIQGTKASHKSYLTHLRNSFLDGSDYYPGTVRDAYNILLRCTPDLGAPGVADNDGVAFVNNGNAPDPKALAHVTCYECGQKGHYANTCPERYNPSADNNSREKTEQATNLCMNGVEEQQHSGSNAFSFSQSNLENGIPLTWVLLDNQSTVDLFCNHELLQNIRESDHRMKVKCNAGYRVTSKIGDLPGYGTVWYDSQSIANILSLMRVTNKYHVAFDSADRGTAVSIPAV